MTDAPHSPQQAWISRNIAQCWPAAAATAIVPLKGDASTRRFWRVAISHARDRQAAPTSAIAIDLGPDDLPLYARTQSCSRSRCPSRRG